MPRERALVILCRSLTFTESGMKIFVAGATGVIGRHLLPLLGAHEVVAMTRSVTRATRLRSAGARAVVADALDKDAVLAAVLEAQPDVIVHELTKIPWNASFRHFDRDFEVTNRLRTQATDYLVAAARTAGVRRIVAQSFAGWTYARSGGMVKTEKDPLDENPPRAFRRTLDAIVYLERTLLETPDIEGLVLRYGFLYGPGTSIGPGGSVLEAVRGRRLPVIGSGAGVWSFVHVADAAAATRAAIERGEPGVYNVSDDTPSPVSVWLPALAEAISAKPPLHVPAWVGRLAIGQGGVAMMTENRGASNDKARRVLGWEPEYARLEEGFATLAGGVSRTRRNRGTAASTLPAATTQTAGRNA
jgi:nucleoside-diphosphate-sugar epimerase